MADEEHKEVEKETGDQQQEVVDTSVRGSIRAAVEEVKEKAEEAPEAKEAKEPTEKKPIEPKTNKEAKEPPELKKPVEAKAPKEKSEDGKQPELDDKPKTVAKDSPKPPPGWTKEARVDWNSLPPDVQKSVLKREEEYSNGIRQYAEKAKAYDELDQVITPHKQAIANFGVTPAQTISKLFEWMNALGHPDQAYKLRAFQELARSFKLDFDAPVDDNTSNQQQFDPRIIDQAVDQRVGPLQQQLQQITQQREQEMRQQAANSIAEWSKSKPYFEQVRQTMFGLIQSGVVPIRADGSLDLDTAYEKAIRLDEDVYAQIQQEAAEQAAEEARQKAIKDAQEKAAKLNKARNVGIGVRPSAPSISAPYARQQQSSEPTRKDTVRDSLRKSIQQMREETA